MIVGQLAGSAGVLRAAYIAAIAARSRDQIHIPFEDVAIGAWRPAVANCHANVAKWIAAHPDTRAVRGWVPIYGDGFYSMTLTAHSVIATRDGTVVDITPIHDEAHRQPEREAMRFIPHLSSDELFFEIVRGGHTFSCPWYWGDDA